MSTMNSRRRMQLARHLQALAYGAVEPERRASLATLAHVVQARLDQPVGEDDLRLLEELSVLRVGAHSVPQRRALLRTFGFAAVERAWRAVPPDRRHAALHSVPGVVLAAAVRTEIDGGEAAPEDIASVTDWVETEGPGTVATSNDFVPENRGLPAGFNVAAFEAAVRRRLEALGGNVAPAFVAVVIGRMLLDGNTEPARSDFSWAVKRGYDQGVAEAPNAPGIPNKEHYARIVDDIQALRPHQKVRYQELAAVADHVIAAADEWDITNAANRRAQVEVGLMRYADGTADTGFAPLELPPIVSADASNQEIEPTNVQAVAMIAAAYEIEQTSAFDVVDRMLELFLQGMLPVRDDSGGRALNRYYWQATDRLDAAARAAQYGRALGKGTTAGADAAPNPVFEQNLLRFVSSVVRYDSDLTVSTVVSSATSDRTGSSEVVRKAAQDLAANASLYGWGFTIFAARRLSRHIDLVFDVLGQETLQRAYGVTGPWQLVERVSAVEFGSTPAIVAHRTRAQAIKDILDLLAVYSAELSRSGAVRRFLPNAEDLRRGEDNGATVSIADYERLVAAANNLLAVGGATDDDIARYSAPVASTARGSIPTVGMEPAGESSGGIDALKQLVMQGQTPSLEQLQRLLPMGSNGLG